MSESDFTRVELLVIRELVDRHHDATLRVRQASIREFPDGPNVALIEGLIRDQIKFQKKMNEKIDAQLLAIGSAFVEEAARWRQEEADDPQDEQDADQPPPFRP